MAHPAIESVSLFLAADKVLAESYVERNPMPGGTADKAGAIARFAMMRTRIPTRTPLSMGAIDVFTFGDGGMNTEHYGVYDLAGTMTQLGPMPGS